MRTTKLAVLSAAIAVAGLGLTGCGGEAAGSRGTVSNDVDTSNGLVIDGETVAGKALWEKAKDRPVSFATALSEETEKALTAQFTKDTGIKVDTVRLPSPKLYERVISEQGAGRLGFDVVRMTDSTAMEGLAAKGALVPASTPFDAQLKKDGARDIGGGRFLSSFYAINTLVYNTQAVPGGDVPKSWQDIVDPKFAEKLGIVNPNGSGYNTALMDMNLQKLGKGYLQKMAAQNPRIFDSVAVQGPALAQGEISVATMSLSAAFGLQNEGAPIKAVLPEEGVSAGYTPFGLTPRGAGNPAAQVFLNWQMSKAGQKRVGSLGLAPARSDVGEQKADGMVLPAPGDPNFIVYTRKDQKEREKSTLATWNSIFHYTG